jgi:hypothetical protein
MPLPIEKYATVGGTCAAAVIGCNGSVVWSLHAPGDTVDGMPAGKAPGCPTPVGSPTTTRSRAGTAKAVGPSGRSSPSATT